MIPEINPPRAGITRNSQERAEASAVTVEASEPRTGSMKPVGNCSKKCSDHRSISSKKMAPKPETIPTAMLISGQRNWLDQP